MFFLLWVKYGFIGLKFLQSYLTYNSIRKDYLEELTITETDACVGEDEDGALTDMRWRQGGGEFHEHEFEVENDKDLNLSDSRLIGSKMTGKKMIGLEQCCLEFDSVGKQ